MVNILQLQPEERVTSLVTLAADAKVGYLFMATKMGTVKKTALADYANVRGSGLIAIKLDSGDELRWVKLTTGKDEIVISTALAQALRFKETEVRPMGRVTRGVRGIRLRPNDLVVGVDIVQPDTQMLVVMENGYGKRTKIDQFTTHARGGVGIKAGVVTAKTGRTVDVRAITDLAEDLVIVSIQGQVIRLALKGISLIGRATQGVRIMRMNADDKVASVALVGEHKMEEELEHTSSNQPTLDESVAEEPSEEAAPAESAADEPAESE